MPRALVLSVDVGSSSVRAGLYSADATSVKGTESRRSHRFVFSGGGRAESDAEALASLVEACIDETLAASRPPDSTVAAVSFSTFLHGMIGADRRGVALTPVLTWADTRSAGPAARLARTMDPHDVAQRTGCPLHPAYFPAKILWFRENDPDLFARVRWWCSIGEYCIQRFTGRRACSLSMASAFGLLNRQTERWDDKLLSALGLDAGCLSPLAGMDCPARGLCREFAERWPALREAAWFPPLGDGTCSSVGAGCSAPPRAALMIGTTGALRAVRAATGAEVPGGLWCYRMDRDWEQVGGVLGDGGNLVEWMRGLMGIGFSAGHTDAALLAAPPAGHGLIVLPFFTGERSTGWDPHARGTISGLSLDTSPLDILQAGMEAVAYRFAAIMDALRPAAPELREVICTGGALRGSPAWVQILADVLEMPLGCADEPEASSRGAAILALEALGLLSRAEAPGPSLTRTFLPRADAAEAHRAAFQAQEHLRRAVLGSRRCHEDD